MALDLSSKIATASSLPLEHLYAHLEVQAHLAERDRRWLDAATLRLRQLELDPRSPALFKSLSTALLRAGLSSHANWAKREGVLIERSRPLPVA